VHDFADKELGKAVSLSRQQQMQTTIAEATTLSRKLPNAEPHSGVAGPTAAVAHR
jgi:hypothetical protein